MNEYELRWIIKDKSVQKNENSERQKRQYTLISMNLDDLIWTIKDQLGQKDKKRQKDKKTKRWWIGLQKHPDNLQWTP